MGIGAPNDLTNCRRFFAEPSHVRQRMYEALRAYFLEGRPSLEVARDFGLHEIDPLANALPPASTNGDHPQLVESLLQALNTMMERLNHTNIVEEPESKEKS